MLKDLLAKHGIAIPQQVVVPESADPAVRSIAKQLSPDAKIKLFRRLFQDSHRSQQEKLAYGIARIPSTANQHTNVWNGPVRLC